MDTITDFSRRGALRTLAVGAAVVTTRPTWSQATRPPVQIVGPWEISGLAPASSGYLFTRMQITETLTDARDDGVPLPGLAQSWTVSPDGLTWRFALRPTARFHDGTAVTAIAVVRCLVAAQVAPALLSLAPIKSIDADGIAHVLIRLNAPFAGLVSLLSHSSTMILAPASYAADGSVRDIIGTGPYRVTSLVPPQKVEAAVFDGFDGSKPVLDRIRYLAAGRAETRTLMAQSGQADLAYGLDPASLARLRQASNVRIESALLPRTVILKVNAGAPALKDVRVRQALSLAIDRAGIATAVLRDPPLAATQLFPSALGGWHAPAMTPLVYSPTAAAKLLAQAGWTKAADGLRDATGKPLTLSLRTFPDRPELPIVAAALQDQWRKAGIAVKVAVGNSGDIPLGHRDGSLELGLAARNYGTVPDPLGTLLQDFGRNGGDWGAMGWQNDEVAKALAELASGSAPAERAASLRSMITSTLQNELPVIPIAWYRQHVAVSQRLAGVSLDPLERSYRLTAMRWRT